ncbi:MAG: DNA-processing protein DprA [Burkholderiaceae bacterium]
MQTQIVPESAWPAHDAELQPPIKRLYFQGDLNGLSQPTMAIVGSRRAGLQGCHHAESIASELVRRGICVASGLALGIDAAAHFGALSQPHGRTIAVLGHGLDQIYPPQHAALAERILDQGGLLLSEYPDLTAPRPHHFLHRNRLIAWVSIGVIVIEAGHRSGALSTAQAAIELGREVMVLPGPVSGGHYSGGHRLIRDGAHLIERGEDVLAACGQPDLFKASSTAVDPQEWRELDPRAAKIMAVLDFQPNVPEDLSRQSGLRLSDLMAGLLVLELRGLASRLVDGRWSLRPPSRMKEF